MQQLEERVEKIDNLVKMKHCGADILTREATNEETMRITHEISKGPVQALFALCPNGFVDLYRLPGDELEKIYREYAEGTRQLFTLDELREMGHEPMDSEDEEDNRWWA